MFRRDIPADERVDMSRAISHELQRMINNPQVGVTVSIAARKRLRKVLLEGAHSDTMRVHVILDIPNTHMLDGVNTVIQAAAHDGFSDLARELVLLGLTDADTLHEVCSCTGPQIEFVAE